MKIKTINVDRREKKNHQRGDERRGNFLAPSTRRRRGFTLTQRVALQRDDL